MGPTVFGAAELSSYCSLACSRRCLLAGFTAARAETVAVISTRFKSELGLSTGFAAT